MKKKILSLCLVVAMVATAVVGASMAYLQDEDSDVNVMTLGNVQIEQHEYERVLNADGTYEMVTTASGTGYKLQEFTQAKPLLPGVGSINGWGTTVYADQLGTSKGGLSVLEGMANVQDKFVSVENTGKTDAYVRTLIAFEQGTMSSEKFNALVMSSLNDYSWDIFETGTVTIDDNNYYVYELVYTDSRLAGEAGVLPAGAFTSFSLGQVYLKPEATNEDCEALDGNGNGTYDILVLSQAVQAAGFADAQTALDTAFGKASENAVAWFEAMSIPVLVSTAAELTAALTAGEDVVLTEDVTVNANDAITVASGNDVTLNLNGHKIAATANDTGNQELFLVKGNMTVENGTLTLTAENNQGWNAMATLFDVTAGGVLNMNGVTADVSGTDMNFVVHLNNWGTATLNVEDCDFTTTYCAVRVFNSGYDMNNVTITNTAFHTGRAFWVHNYTSENKDDTTLNLDIYNNGNTSDHKTPVRFGFSNATYYDLSGNQVPNS